MSNIKHNTCAISFNQGHSKLFCTDAAEIRRNNNISMILSIVSVGQDIAVMITDFGFHSCGCERLWMYSFAVNVHPSNFTISFMLSTDIDVDQAIKHFQATTNWFVNGEVKCVLC